MARLRVILIGGGIAGLACATSLAARGCAVTVLERDDRLGGRAASFVDEATGEAVDLGPHVVLSEYRNFFAWLRGLGADPPVLWLEQPMLTLLDGEKRVELAVARLPAPLHMLPALPRVPLRWRDLASDLPAMARALALDDERMLALDAEPAEQVLARCGVRPALLDWHWRSLSMWLMNAPLERCSAGALMRLYRQLCGVGDLRIGLPAVALADLFEPAARRALDAHGARVRCGTNVESLVVEAGVARGVFAGGERLDADAVVAAVAPAQLAAIATGLDAVREPFPPCRYVSVYLWFDRAIARHPMWSNVWSPDQLNYDFYDLSLVRRDRKRDGAWIASNIIDSDRIGDMDNATIVARTLDELARFAPDVRDAQLLRWRVHRIDMAIPSPRPGFEARRPPQRTAIGGLYLAGDWTNTGLPCSMEGATRSGLLAAESLLHDHGNAEPIAHAALEPDAPARLLARFGSALWRRDTGHRLGKGLWGC